MELREFREEDVDVYYEWMQDEELLKLTGTAPMTKEDVLGLLNCSQSGECLVKIIHVEGFPIGDIDLFNTGGDEVEINMMIARKDYRGRGYGKEALSLFFKEHVPVGKRVWAKIREDNTISRKMFESFGFRYEQKNAFGEIEYSFIKLN